MPEDHSGQRGQSNADGLLVAMRAFTTYPLSRAPRTLGGFTLVELLTVVVILAIIAAIAMPGLEQALVNQRLRAAGTDLMSSLMLARSEAIKRRSVVEVAPLSGNDWRTGWRVINVKTGKQIDKKDALGRRVTVALAPAVIDYDRYGRMSVAGVTRVQFADSDPGNAAERSRCVTIDPGGLPRIATGPCP